MPKSEAKSQQSLARAQLLSTMRAGGMFDDVGSAVGVLRSALHLPGSRRLLISASGIGSLPFARIAQINVVRAGNDRAETVVDHATAQKPHCGAA